MLRQTPRRMSSPATAAAPVPVAPLSRDSELAAEVKALVLSGKRDAARERFGELVALLQRRAARIAYQYLRDLHDADEAVQDAFVKVFTHITTYREEFPFEVWFTRILINRCLDLQKARSRRLRWSVPAPATGQALTPEPAAPQQTWRRSTSFQSVSGSCSRCVRSPSRVRTRSVRRSASVKPPCECISFERCGSCAACSQRSDEHAQKSSLRRPAY
jgi:RNA polymerase sigma factor (sigma-70 family)